MTNADYDYMVALQQALTQIVDAVEPSIDGWDYDGEYSVHTIVEGSELADALDNAVQVLNNRDEDEV